MLEHAAGTLRALGAPRRAVPMTVLAIPLVWAQVWFTPDPRAAAVGLALCASFVLTAPLCWRALFPVAGGRGPVLGRAALYLLAGVAGVIGVGLGVGHLAGLPSSFLTSTPSLLVMLALYWVGGWGLGRDIDLEARLDQEVARSEALARAAERAELLAVRSHLDPHFLFNTLNAIAEWCREDPEVAERALLRLSDMLRTVLSAIREPTWTLARELDLVAALGALYEVRDPDRFRLEIHSEEVDGVVPPMLVLSLVENAFKHGPAKGHRGPVRVAVAADAGLLRITVDNPGPFEPSASGGEGLALARRRLALVHGADARLDLASAAARTTATLILPRGAP